jgi:lysine 6-dehydrogenase
LFAGARLVVSAVPYRFGPDLAVSAIAAGAHYFDFGGNPGVVAEQRDLDAVATAAGVAVVPDCGLAPGLAGVLAVDVIERLGGTADEIRLRVGALPQVPRGPLGYQLAFSPLGLINEYDAPCEIITGGEYATIEPLTGMERVEWPGRGPLEAFHTAGGSSSLPRRFVGRVRELDYKTLRYPGHGEKVAVLRALGLFDEAAAPAMPAVSPRAVLAGLLAERLPRDAPDVVLARITGRVDDRRIGYELEDVADDRFSALARTTAFPATALADLIAREEIGVTGVRTMDEAAPAAQLLTALATREVEARLCAS